MIIVLKGADFSANNLGQVDVPITYTEKMLNYFEALGNSTLSEEKKQAAAKLVAQLEYEGLMSKIGYLFLPVLSNSVEQSMINLASDDLEVINPINASLDENNGLVISRNGNIPKFYLRKLSNYNGLDFHWMYFPTKDNANISLGDWNADLFAVTEVGSDGVYLATSNYRSYKRASGEPSMSIEEIVSDGGSKFGTGSFTSLPNGKYFKGYINDSRPKYLRDKEVSVCPETYKDNSPGQYIHTYKFNNTSKPFDTGSGILGVDGAAVLSFGNKLTDAEALKYQEIVNQFAKKIGLI